MEYTKTEVHTHFLGMLSADDFIDFIKDYTDYIYWSLYGDEDVLIKVDELRGKEVFLDRLRIEKGKTIDDYNQSFGDFYGVRKMLIDFLVSFEFLRYKNEKFTLKNLAKLDDIDSNNICLSIIKYAQGEINKKENKEIVDDIMQEVFSNYFNRCLEELINSGVKYTEVSYSNPKIISLLNIDEDIKDKIGFKFLLSTNRENMVNTFMANVKNLKKALKTGRVIGFDIMGKEGYIDSEYQESEYKKACKSNSQARKTYSLKYELEKLMEVFYENGNENTVLRIHSGETKYSMGNTKWILETLKEIKDEYKKEDSTVQVLPPPQLRIGHGIKFDPDDERYAKLLREFNASVEFNISSNLALRNINSVDELPFEFYVKNKIPILISTDGNGLYDTSIKEEDALAREVLLPEQFNFIVENDREFRRKHR